MSTDTNWDVSELCAELGVPEHAVQTSDGWAAWVRWSGRVNKRLSASEFDRREHGGRASRNAAA